VGGAGALNPIERITNLQWEKRAGKGKSRDQNLLVEKKQTSLSGNQKPGRGVGTGGGTKENPRKKRRGDLASNSKKSQRGEQYLSPKPKGVLTPRPLGG